MTNIRLSCRARVESGLHYLEDIVRHDKLPFQQGDPLLGLIRRIHQGIVEFVLCGEKLEPQRKSRP